MDETSLDCYVCGAGGQKSNAYCKRCGEWLPSLKKRSRMALGGDTPQQNLFTSLYMSALSAAVALVSAIALYATYLGTPEAKWSIYLAAAFCLCIAGWQITSFMVALKLRRRIGKGREKGTQLHIDARHSPALGAANTRQFVTTPSVTEQTTELLEPVGRVKTDKNG
jgi:hypothetical protein